MNKLLAIIATLGLMLGPKEFKEALEANLKKKAYRYMSCLSVQS